MYSKASEKWIGITQKTASIRKQVAKSLKPRHIRKLLGENVKMKWSFEGTSLADSQESAGERFQKIENCAERKRG